MKKLSLAVTLVILGLVVLSPAQEARAAICNHNEDSELLDFSGDWACAGHGGGCDVCFRRAPRGDGSWSLCYFSVRLGTEVCTHYM